MLDNAAVARRFLALPERDDADMGAMFCDMLFYGDSMSASEMEPTTAVLFQSCL